MPKVIDKHCTGCRGTGVLWHDVPMEDGISTTFTDCYCVEYRLTPDEKARINAALLASSTLAYDLEPPAKLEGDGG